MVTTRSGERHNHLVRFKRGVAVKRFLDFNSPSNWDLSPEAFNSRDINSQDHKKSNGSLSTAAKQNGCHHHNSSESSDGVASADTNDTILYDINCTPSLYESVIWDTIMFITIILICYTIAAFSCEYILHIYSICRYTLHY